VSEKLPIHQGGISLFASLVDLMAVLKIKIFWDMLQRELV
jgi:hypothetical protein